MTNICFIDTETTGLDPDRHAIWEVALITPDGGEHVWQFPVDEMSADPIALDIGRYWDRRWSDDNDVPLVSVIYDAHNAKSRHLIDVEALAAGYLASMARGLDNIDPLQLPWDSNALTAALGITVSDEDKHTALGDARWARAIYDAVSTGK